MFNYVLISETLNSETRENNYEPYDTGGLEVRQLRRYFEE